MGATIKSDYERLVKLFVHGSKDLISRLAEEKTAVDFSAETPHPNQIQNEPIQLSKK
jgi:hypothetical protein